MLTPVDIQQKKFKTGLGFDKKDVQTFFDEVSASYVELYRSNADLKEQLITLTDTVQRYKAQEDNLQKSLLLAEKNTEESKTNAEKSAKAIEMEARSRANEIIKDAKDELDQLQTEYAKLESRYAEYKTKFAALLRSTMAYLKENDYDPTARVTHPSEEESSSRAEDFSSGLGGAGSVGNSREQNRSNSSNVYGSTLGGDGINPFRIKD